MQAVSNAKSPVLFDLVVWGVNGASPDTVLQNCIDYETFIAMAVTNCRLHTWQTQPQNRRHHTWQNKPRNRRHPKLDLGSRSTNNEVQTSWYNDGLYVANNMHICY